MNWLRTTPLFTAKYRRKAKANPIFLPPRIDQLYPKETDGDDGGSGSQRGGLLGGVAPVITFGNSFTGSVATFETPVDSALPHFPSPSSLDDSDGHHTILLSEEKWQSPAVLPLSLRHPFSRPNGTPNLRPLPPSVPHKDRHDALQNREATAITTENASNLSSATLSAPSGGTLPRPPADSGPLHGAVLHLMDRSPGERRRLKKEQRQAYRAQCNHREAPVIVRIPRMGNGGETSTGDTVENPNGALASQETGTINEGEEEVGLLLCTTGRTLLEYVEGVIQLRVAHYQKMSSNPPVGKLYDAPPLYQVPPPADYVNGATSPSKPKLCLNYYNANPFTYEELVNSSKMLSTPRRREIRALVTGIRSTSPEVYGAPTPYTSNPMNDDAAAPTNKRVKILAQSHQPSAILEDKNSFSSLINSVAALPLKSLGSQGGAGSVNLEMTFPPPTTF